ncbi:NXPE family member 1-like isoform X1 [Acipenser oxyrinchus oxyrinchus]|uniref:NXPE family member 1-like isoform X1 n=1 Tax=Acipenser oxyrinchus oxyrinchus TaxID=40147 RepID=A0AAD8FQP8_ACIOX|nr:NXPE family member 1-like isoform X1 [Acipenser oxyrinchus oxyrinchus]
MAAAEITLNRRPPLSSSNKKKILLLLLLPCVILTSWLQPGKWFDRPHLLPPNPGLHDTARLTEAKVNKILQELKKHVPKVNQTQLELTSSGAHSLVTLINPKENYCVGEIVSVRVEMNDYHGKPKTYGRDFVLARIHSPKLKAGAAGVLEDFNNGTYRVNFTLFWPGSVKVSVLLMHSSEVVSALWRTRKFGTDKFIFTGTFRNGTLQETSRCDIHLSTNETLCEFKDERNQESFFCFKPKTLPCETLHYTRSRNSEASCLTDAEEQLLKRSAVGVKIPNHFKDMTVGDCKVGRVPQAAEKCELGMSSPTPSGFFHSDRWSSSYCRMRSFQNVSDMNQCLQGKQVYLRGDSTIRQWIEYFGSTLKNLKCSNGSEQHAPRTASDKKRNITMSWKHHGFPWVSANSFFITKEMYIFQELDRVAGGENTVVVISVGQHLRPFPLKLYITRMVTIKQAVTRLLQRSPLTRVFVKSENTRELNSEIIRMSNWHGHLQNLALKEVFRGVKVGFIDAWDMTVAANSFSIHPPNNIVKNQVTLFLSYLCNDS